MAQPLICSMDGVEKATWIIGEVETGNQYAACDICLMGWMLAKLDADLTPEGKAHVATMWTRPAAPATPEGGSADDAPKRGSRRPGRSRIAEDGRRQAEVDQEAPTAALAAQEAEEARQAPADPATTDES